MFCGIAMLIVISKIFLPPISRINFCPHWKCTKKRKKEKKHKVAGGIIKVNKYLKRCQTAGEQTVHRDKGKQSNLVHGRVKMAVDF